MENAETSEETQARMEHKWVTVASIAKANLMKKDHFGSIKGSGR